MRYKMIMMLLGMMVAGTASAERYEEEFARNRLLGDETLQRKGVSTLVVGYIFKVYTAALYQLPDAGPADVLGDQPRFLEILYLRSITKDAFLKAAEDMLAQQHRPEEIEAIRPGISAINALYQDVNKGDRYALSYVSGVGTELFFNGQSRGIIPGAAFARLYFSIWLGENHPYQRFRDRLVGL